MTAKPRAAAGTRGKEGQPTGPLVRREEATMGGQSHPLTAPSIQLMCYKPSGHLAHLSRGVQRGGETSQRPIQMNFSLYKRRDYWVYLNTCFDSMALN